jgi:hypothetical protein
MRWTLRWSSEDICYGGCGTPALLTDSNWRLLGEAALWLAPEKDTDKDNKKENQNG